MPADLDDRSRRRGHPWSQLKADPEPATDPSGARRLGGLAAWITLLVVVLVGFAGLGDGPLAAPPFTDPGSWGDWAAARTAPEAAFAVVRVAVQVIAGYLLLATLLAVAATVWQGGRLLSVVEVVTLPVVRRMVQGMVGVSLATASVAAVGAGPGSALPAPTVADVELARADRTILPGTGSEVMYLISGEEASLSPAPVMRLLVDPGSPPSAVAPTPTADEPAPAAAAPVPEAIQAPAGEWLVEPGDHIWSIAERALTDAGVDASDAAVASYSEAIVHANHDRLADAGNPDLLYPGQSLILPAVPPG